MAETDPVIMVIQHAFDLLDVCCALFDNWRLARISSVLSDEAVSSPSSYVFSPAVSRHSSYEDKKLINWLNVDMQRFLYSI